ncbi:unnamed protein product, partial [Gongylonema pulchrum]|uniref:SH3 domain-containing protein n=1 Tax=Gongylonema pulchrum TaxID=637853 RepID=A0A183EF51_9BILA
MFGSLSRLAGDALQGAKHATEQLAQAAQHAASTSELTSLSKVRSQQKMPLSSPVSPSTSFHGSEIPPGLEDLSMEERQKILAVMAVAELDSIADGNRAAPAKIPISQTSDSFFRNDNERLDSTSSLPEPPKVDYRKEASPPTTMLPEFSTENVIDGVDLSYLSPAEREQIISVMKAAQSEEPRIIPPVSPTAPETAAVSAVPVD